MTEPETELKPWQWTRPDLHARLSVGTVLMTDDGHCFAVTEITPEGVVSPWIGRGMTLLTWEDLERKECTIFGHVDNDPGLPRGPLIRERGGRINEARAPADEGERLDRAVIAGLLGLMAAGANKLTLRANREDGGKKVRVLLTDGAGGGVAVDHDVFSGVTAVFEHTALSQHRPADALTLLLERRAEGWWYALDFEYE